jgi:hypothetical protein
MSFRDSWLEFLLALICATEGSGKPASFLALCSLRFRLPIVDVEHSVDFQQMNHARSVSVWMK